MKTILGLEFREPRTLFLESFAQLYDVKYPYQIKIIFSTLNGFMYSYLTFKQI